MVAKAERSRTNRGHDLDLLMPRDVIRHVIIAAPRSLLELTQNVIRSSHGHSTPSLKISRKSVQPFSHNVADKEISIAASRGLPELTQKASRHLGSGPTGSRSIRSAMPENPTLRSNGGAENAGLENAGLDFGGPNSRTGKCRTRKCRTGK